MHIKKIIPSEYRLVTGLFDKYRVFYKQPSDIALAERFIKARLENNESVIFVALTDENIATGFTQLYPVFSSGRAAKNWVLNDLYVDAGYRRRGIGEALIKTAIAFAGSENSTYIKLETANDNYNAQKLYEAIGFRKQDPDTAFLTYRFEIGG